MASLGINITGSSGAGTDYQVLLKIGESSGSSGAHFHLGGGATDFPAAKNDGGDFRFIGAGAVNLPFWVEKVTGSGPNRVAHVWVKVAQDLGSSRAISMTYNTGDTNASDGASTFSLFDDFNDGSVDTGKWTIEGTISESGDNLSFGDNTNDGDSLSSIATFGAGYACKFKGTIPPENGSYNILGFEQVGFYDLWEQSNLYLYNGTDTRSDGSANTGISKSGPSGEWEIFRNPDGTAAYKRDGSSIGTRGENYTTANKIRFGNYSGGPGTVDYVFVRKYVTTEPAFASTFLSDTYQRHARFRKDDGDEDGASWAAGEDANLLSLPEAKRLRVQLDVDGDLGSAPIQLEYSVAGANDWKAIKTDFVKIVGQQEWTTPGTYSFVVPDGVTSISAVTVGSGGAGCRTTSAGGGGRGGALRYITTLAVTPGETLTIVVPAGGSPSGGNGAAAQILRSGTPLLQAAGGGGGTTAGDNGVIGTSSTIGGTIGGGDGGAGATASGSTSSGGGGGAGGYSGNGGSGSQGGTGSAGSGGGGGGGSGGGSGSTANGGGGVGIYGAGSDGAANGGGGSGGSNNSGAYGGNFGGGGGGDDNNGGAQAGAGGAVRIIWGAGRAYPSTNVADDNSGFSGRLFKLSLSSNIAASAATDTTAQLTPPTGKTTSDFYAGKISDDTNPVTVSIGTDGYTEVEFCIIPDLTAVEEDDAFDFRVTLNGSPLTGYDEIPTWTFGNADAGKAFFGFL